MHHPRDRIVYIAVFVTPVVGDWLEREIVLPWFFSVDIVIIDENDLTKTNPENNVYKIQSTTNVTVTISRKIIIWHIKNRVIRINLEDSHLCVINVTVPEYFCK